jgi:hypothetical protein
MIYFVLSIWTRFPAPEMEKSRAVAALLVEEELRLLCGGFDVVPLGGGEVDCGCGDVLFEVCY